MGEPIATLSMYDWPETRSALDELWGEVGNALMERGIRPPTMLHHQDSQMPLWTSPDLVVGQTCGWPFANLLLGKATVFGRFDYGLPDCPAGYYQSVFIGQSEADTRFLGSAESLSKAGPVAVNGDDSQSGFHVFSEIANMPASCAIAEGQRLITGAHRLSLKAVADGNAQIAAIDAVAFELAKRHEPESFAKVVEIGRTRPRPGLPLITAISRKDQRGIFLEAMHSALQDVRREVRETLLIKDVVAAGDDDYLSFRSD